MELPPDLLILIKEFSKPITRPNWRQGSILNRNNITRQSIRDHLFWNFRVLYWIQIINY